MRFLRTALALLTLAALPACSPSTSATNPGDAADAAVADDAGDAAPDVLKPPTIKATLIAQPLAGNAPLDLALTVTIEGVDKSQCFVTWDYGDGLKDEPFDLSKEEFKDKDSVHHTYQNKGTYTVKAVVEWKPSPKKAHAEATATISVSSPASLLFSSDPSVKLESPETVSPGDDVTLTFAISNEGDDVETPFEVSVYMSATDVVDDSAQLVATVKVPSLAAAKVLTFQYDPDPTKTTAVVGKVPAGLADGAYYVLVQIDPKKTVNEVDRLDNLAIAGTQLNIDTKVTAKSDLIITAPTFNEAKTYSPGDAVNFNYTVANQGLGEAKGVKFGVFLSKDTKLDFDPDKAADDPSQVDKMLTNLANSTFQHIAPNSSLPLVYSVVVPDVADGPYYLLAKIDLFNVMDETDEANNLAVTDKQLTVLKVVKSGVDLALLDMTVKPKGVALKDAVNVLYTVKNTGTAPTPAFPAGIYFCPNKAFSKANCFINQTNFSIDPLAPGETKSGFKSVTISQDTPVQNWFVYLQLDPDGKVVELDESNNTKTFDNLKVVSTSNVDLWPENIGFHPVSVTAGGAVKVGYTVHNDGTTGAPGATTWYALTAGGVCSAGAVQTGQAVLVKKVPFNGLDPFDQVEIADVLPIPLGLNHALSQYQLCVILDAEKAIAKETNPNNNSALSKDFLQVVGAQGGCFEDAADQGTVSNNSAQKAVPLALDSTATLGSCGNEDWWTVPVPKGHSLVVTMTSTPDLWTTDVPGDLDIDIYAPDGKTLLESVKQPGTLKKASALTVAVAGDYVLRVYPHVPGAQAQYKLAVQVIGPAQGPDLFAGGLTVSPQSTYPGALVKTKLKLSNLGNQGTGPFTVRYVLSTDIVIDAKDQVLKDVAYDKGLDASASQVTDQTLVLPVVAGGKWFIGVLADSGSQVPEADEGNNSIVSNALQLSSQLSCATDAYSGNHTVDDAASLPPVTATYAKLNVCPGLEDWFAVQVPEGKTFSAKLGWKYLAGKGLVGVQIVDPSKTAVVAGAASSVNSLAKIPYVQTGGTYYIHTYVLPETGSPVPYDYDLTVTLAEPDPSDVCLADYYEGNNSAQSGPELGCGLASLSLCLGDEDWFHLTMQKGEVVTLDLENPAQAFQLKIFDNYNLPPIKVQAANGPLVFTAPATGTYYMQIAYKVAGQKPASFAYTLKVDGGKGVDLLAKLQSVFPAQIVQGEDVYVTAQVSNVCQDPAGPFSYAYYYSTDAKLDAQDLLLAQKGIAGLAGKASASFDDKAIIPLEAKPGPAYLILAADASNTVAESQELNNSDSTAIQVVPLCLADALEPNGAPQIAALLVPGKTADLSLCPYDLDWYTFEAKQGETLTLTMAFDQAVGDLDLRLYKVAKFGQPVAVSATKKSPEQIVWTADESTKYYVRINGFAGDANAYSLSLCKKVGGSCLECASDLDCGPGAVCNASTTQCVVPTCKENPTLCQDGNACTQDTCSAEAVCLHQPATGTACDDGDACSLNESCAGDGACTPPTQPLVVPTVYQDFDEAQGHALASTPDGGFLRGGGHFHGDSVGNWADVERYDAKGQLLWGKGYSFGEDVRGVVALPSGDVAVVGTRAQNGTKRAWFGDIDIANGTLLTAQGVSDTGTSSLDALVAVAGGSQVVAVGSGPAVDVAQGGQDAWAVRLDLDGKVLWEARWGDSPADGVTGVVALGTQAVLAVGTGADPGSVGSQHGLAARLDADTGAVVWKIAAPVGTTWRAVALASEQTAVVVGEQASGQGQITWLSTVDGTILATQPISAATPQDPTFTGTKSVQLRAIQILTDGSLIVAGRTGAATALGGFDGAIWQSNPTGTVKSLWSYGKGGADGLDALLPWQGTLLGYGTITTGLQLNHTGQLLLQILPSMLDCVDGNPCTIDSCSANAGCSHVPAADATPCGTGLTCQAGACK